VDGIKDGVVPENLPPGVTRAFAEDALPVLDDSDRDGVLGDCHLQHAEGQASNQNMSIVVRRLSSTAIQLDLRGRVANPLIALAEPIDWDLRLVIDSTSSPHTWHLTGREDGFPAIEIYVNESPIYQ